MSYYEVNSPQDQLPTRSTQCDFIKDFLKCINNIPEYVKMHVQIYLVVMNLVYNHDCWSKNSLILHSLTNAYSVLNGGASNRKTYTNCNYLLKAWVWVQGLREGRSVAELVFYLANYAQIYVPVWYESSRWLKCMLLQYDYDCNVLMVVQLQVMWHLPLLLNRTEDNLPVRESWWPSLVKWMDH